MSNITHVIATQGAKCGAAKPKYNKALTKKTRCALSSNSWNKNDAIPKTPLNAINYHWTFVWLGEKCERRIWHANVNMQFRTDDR